MPSRSPAATACGPARRRAAAVDGNRRRCRCRAGTVSFPHPPQLLGVLEESGLFQLFLRRKAALQAASSSGESQPGSTWSMRANNAVTPSGRRRPVLLAHPRGGRASSDREHLHPGAVGHAAGASRITWPFLIVPSRCSCRSSYIPVAGSAAIVPRPHSSWRARRPSREKKHSGAILHLGRWRILKKGVVHIRKDTVPPSCDPFPPANPAGVLPRPSGSKPERRKRAVRLRRVMEVIVGGPIHPAYEEPGRQEAADEIGVREYNGR